MRKSIGLVLVAAVGALSVGAMAMQDTGVRRETAPPTQRDPEVQVRREVPPPPNTQREVRREVPPPPDQVREVRREPPPPDQVREVRRDVPPPPPGQGRDVLRDVPPPPREAQRDNPQRPDEVTQRLLRAIEELQAQVSEQQRSIEGLRRRMETRPSTGVGSVDIPPNRISPPPPPPVRPPNPPQAAMRFNFNEEVMADRMAEIEQRIRRFSEEVEESMRMFANRVEEQMGVRRETGERQVEREVGERRVERETAAEARSAEARNPLVNRVSPEARAAEARSAEARARAAEGQALTLRVERGGDAGPEVRVIGPDGAERRVEIRRGDDGSLTIVIRPGGGF